MWRHEDRREQERSWIENASNGSNSKLLPPVLWVLEDVIIIMLLKDVTNPRTLIALVTITPNLLFILFQMYVIKG